MNNKDMMLNRPEIKRGGAYELYGNPYLVQVKEEFPSIMLRALVGKVVVVGEIFGYVDHYAHRITAPDVVLVPCDHNDKIFGLENLPKDYCKGICHINRKWLTRVEEEINDD